MFRCADPLAGEYYGNLKGAAKGSDRLVSLR